MRIEYGNRFYLVWVIAPIMPPIFISESYKGYIDIKRKDGAPRYFLRRILNYIKQ